MIGLLMPMQTPVNIFTDEVLVHRVEMGFQIAADGFGNQFIHIGNPTLLNHSLRLLPKMVGDFGLDGGHYGEYAFG